MAPLVLVVEDEQKIRDLLRRYLERDGLTVLSTGSGAEAIAIAGEARPDLVVLDLGLPDVPGEEVARELRSRAEIPIVMLTARAEERDRIAGLELGADDYVTKPFSPRELVLRVRAVLRRRAGPAAEGPLSFGGGFIGAAIAAVAALALVIVLITHSETRALSATDRAHLADEVARVLADAYQRAGSWRTAEPSGASVLATGADAVLIVTDSAGSRVLGPAAGLQRGQGRGAGSGIGAGAGSGAGAGIGTGAGTGAITVTRPILVSGKPVGTAELRFRDRLTHAQSVLRDHLTAAVLLGSAIAIAIALLGAALVTRTLTRPLQRLIAAARRLQAGDLGARVATDGAPGELGELSRAFDAMAQTLEHERRSRRRIVSNLAHEVRTPISILQGNLEEMVDQVAEPTPERLGSLHEEVIRLGTLVADLDTLALADAPPNALELTSFDLAALAGTQLDALRPQLDAKGLGLERALEPVSVCGDRARVGQVLANLLSNAIKFTPEGGTITVETGPSERGARISVSDTGPGIPAGEREHVLEWFWRGSAGRGISGRGVGLAVVADIVRAHHGEIAIEQAQDRGARFTVTLPQG